MSLPRGGTQREGPAEDIARRELAQTSTIFKCTWLVLINISPSKYTAGTSTSYKKCPPRTNKKVPVEYKKPPSSHRVLVIKYLTGTYKYLYRPDIRTKYIAGTSYKKCPQRTNKKVPFEYKQSQVPAAYYTLKYLKSTCSICTCRVLAKCTRRVLTCKKYPSGTI